MHFLLLLLLHLGWAASAAVTAAVMVHLVIGSLQLQ
jgi:hypothetical protein